MHNLFVFIPFIIILVIAVIVPRAMISFKVKALKTKMKDLGTQFNDKGEGTHTIDGKSVNVQYVPASRYTPSKFRLYTSGIFGAELVIRKGTSYDKFYQKIGLNREIKINDPQLNDKFYFECDDEEFLNQLLSISDIKPFLLDVLTNFTSIEITKDSCCFQKSPCRSFDEISQELISTYSKKLLDLSTLVPQTNSFPNPGIDVFKLKAKILTPLGYVPIVLGFISFIWASGQFRVVDTARAWTLTSYWSLVIFLAVSYIVFLNIRGFSRSSRSFIPFLTNFAIGLVLCLRFGGAIINGVLDKSSAISFEQLVINKYTTTNKGSTYYHAEIAPWHSGMNSWKINVSQINYGNIQPGITHCLVYTKAGRFGFEWVVAEKLIINSSFSLGLGQTYQSLASYDMISINTAQDLSKQGNIQFRQGNLAQAIIDFNKAIAINPKFAPAYCYRGLVYKKQGNIAQAMADYNKAIELNPNFAVAYNNRGVIYKMQGNFDQALAEYNKAIALNPKYIIAYNNRGAIYGKQGNYALAMADFNKSIEINPKYAKSYYERAVNYYHLKQYDLAWTDVHKAQDLGYHINPDFINALKGASAQ